MKIILYDNTENGVKEWFWRRYIQVRAGWRKFGVASWHDGIDRILDAVRPGTRLMELQIWGDGSPSMPAINGKAPPEMFWKELANLVTPESIVWFRMCSVFYGEKGLRFAHNTALQLGCRVAGHSRIIGPWQSGLFRVTPGGTPSWADPERFENWMDAKSGPFQQRTIACFRMSFHDSW